ncbi:EF0163 family protein [Tetragenococcus solitarius]|uniref:DUF5067 domain-containing protein n=1 Tax=Tetragenococcus solitarius TaxID=71453 RepID=A0ABN3YDY0_9ENTE|nr:EF0163 family protein [Tetragenococcus solitarius]
MKKQYILLWLAGIILFIVSVLYLLNLSQRNDDFFLEETTETANEVTNTTTSSSNGQADEVATLLADFGDDWLNFSNTTERNQKLEKYMTEEAIENNQPETKEKESTGEITSITQDIEHPQKYILLGEKTTQGKTKEVILEVELTSDPSPKINHLESSYKK